MKKKLMIHNAPTCEARPGVGIVWSIDRREVRVMAEAEGFAMVRRKGCMPYVCAVEELEPMPQPANATP